MDGFGVIGLVAEGVDGFGLIGLVGEGVDGLVDLGLRRVGVYDNGDIWFLVRGENRHGLLGELQRA